MREPHPEPDAEGATVAASDAASLLFRMQEAESANATRLWSRATHARGLNSSIAERLVTFSLLVDALVVILSLVGSYWIRFNTGIHEFGIPATLTMGDYAPYMAIGSILFLYALHHFGVYDRHFLLRGRQVAIKIESAAMIWLVGLCFVTFILRFSPPISRVYVLIAGLTTMGALLTWRAIFHRVLRHSKLGSRLRQRVMVIGWSNEARQLMDSFQADPHSSFTFVGHVNSAEPSPEVPDGVALLGHVQDIGEIMQRNRPDVVLLSDVGCMKDEIVSIANLCERELVQFKIVPSYFQILVSGLRLESVHGTPVLGVTQLPLDQFHNQVFKRVIDVIGAVVGLVISAPLMLLFGFLVYRESPGPIFYRQRRLGRNGLHFDIYKIRSMRLNAEQDGKIGWSTKNDDRRLKIGSFMRRWNLDELPQFLNVLKGEMSLVGPRPERPELIVNFRDEIPHYNARHAIKPGITGWAQVNGLRGDTDLSERIKCDLWYLENWNLLLDTQIMFLTFLKRDHAC